MRGPIDTRQWAIGFGMILVAVGITLIAGLIPGTQVGLLIGSLALNLTGLVVALTA